jgi:hypothetical protein
VYGFLMEVLTIAVEKRFAGDVFAIGIQRSYWRLVGFGQSEASRESVEREGKRGQHHCINAVGVVRRIVI